MASLKTVALSNLSTGDDFDVAILSVWDGSEVAVTIIAACIPTLRVLVRDSLARRSSASRTTALFGKRPAPGGVWPYNSYSNNVTITSDSRCRKTQHPLEKLYTNNMSDDFIITPTGGGRHPAGAGGGWIEGIVCTDEVDVRSEESCEVSIGEGYECLTPGAGQPEEPGGRKFELQDLGNLSSHRSRD